MTEPFSIDRDYDRENASEGKSRYTAYVRQAIFDPWTDDQAVELAVFAWRQATTPVMSPGYVRRHPRISAARLERSEWDGSLLACVDLVMPQPKHLCYLRSDDERGHWRDWPREHSFFSDADIWLEPSGEELARSPYLLCTASLRFMVPSSRLPQPPERWRDRGPFDPAELTDTCRQAIGLLVREMSTIVGPVIDRIEAS